MQSVFLRSPSVSGGCSTSYSGPLSVHVASRIRRFPPVCVVQAASAKEQDEVRCKMDQMHCLLNCRSAYICNDCFCWHHMTACCTACKTFPAMTLCEALMLWLLHHVAHLQSEAERVLRVRTEATRRIRALGAKGRMRDAIQVSACTDLTAHTWWCFPCASMGLRRLMLWLYSCSRLALDTLPCSHTLVCATSMRRS